MRKMSNYAYSIHVSVLLCRRARAILDTPASVNVELLNLRGNHTETGHLPTVYRDQGGKPDLRSLTETTGLLSLTETTGLLSLSETTGLLSLTETLSTVTY